MAENKKIKTALVSVFHKDGLDELLKKLNEEGVKFLSEGCSWRHADIQGRAVGSRSPRHLFDERLYFRRRPHRSRGYLHGANRKEQIKFFKV